MNVEELLIAAEQAMDESDYSHAVELLEDAYQMEQTQEINRRLVTSLEAAEQFEHAYRIATERAWVSYVDVQEQETFMRLALKVNRPIAARKMLSQFIGDVESWQQKIVSSENESRLNEQTRIKEMTREFYHLGQTTLTDQHRLLSEMDQLPLKEYVFSAKGVLTDPFSNPLIRATVFESLQHLKYSEDIEMLSVLGDVHVVNAAHSSPLKEMASYKEMLHHLVELENDMDPIMWQGLSQQSELMLQIMYPFVDFGITNVADWLNDVQVMMFGFGEMRSEPEQQRWQHAIWQAITEILGN